MRHLFIWITHWIQSIRNSSHRPVGPPLCLHYSVHLHVIDVNGGRNGTDKADQLLVGVNPHSTVPLRQPARRSQGPEEDKVSQKCHTFLCTWINIWTIFKYEKLPEQELRRIVKSEHVIIIFNIVLVEKGVKLLELVVERRKRYETKSS